MNQPMYLSLGMTGLGDVPSVAATSTSMATPDSFSAGLAMWSNPSLAFSSLSTLGALSTVNSTPLNFIMGLWAPVVAAVGLGAFMLLGGKR